MSGKIAQVGTTAVVAHAAAVVLHGLAHARIPVPMSAAQNAFIAVVIGLGPIVAGILLWSRLQRAGVWLLLGTMLGSLAFGAYHHFVAAGPDHVSQVPADEWGILFRVTAILLLAAEGIGCLVGLWGLRAPRHSPVAQLRRGIYFVLNPDKLGGVSGDRPRATRS